MKKLLFLLLFLSICTWQAKSENQLAEVVWPLTSETQQTASLSGQLDNAYLNLNGLAVNSYGSPDATITISLAEGGSASWHTAENADRYIEFSVSPKAGSIFHANEISVYVCGKGGGNMRANFYYSKDVSFAERTRINYRQDTDLTRDNALGYEKMTVSIDETIAAGEKIYFRIYPYYKSVTTGKYLCLKNAVISGATEATAVTASVIWPFTGDLKPVVSGSLLAAEMSFGNGIELYDYSTSVPTLAGEAISGGSVGPSKTTSCAWTGSDIPLDDIYIQYQVAPKTGAMLTITNVSMLISAFSTNSMKAAVYYSKNADFSNKQLLKESTAMQSAVLDKWDCSLNEVVASGEVFYLRVYPHHITSATWKLLNLRNVTVSGTMIGATVDPAEVSTVSVISNISTTTAIGGGVVLNDGGASVIARGMVWSTSALPSITDSKSVDGEGAGSFESTLNELAAATTYYARAYATNKAGTSYGAEVSFTTLSALFVPSVNISAGSSILNTSLIISGAVMAWGGTDVTERGVVWGTESNPTTATNKVASGQGLGSFQSYIDGLTPQTKYYFRAYATNATGTAYSNELEYTTKATDPDVTKVIAQDGSGDYTTVQEAFDAVPSYYTGKWILQIKAGTYNERPTLIKAKVNVYLIGENAQTTIITHNTYAGMEKPGGGTWGTSGSQTMAIEADDFMAVDITIENTYVNSKTNAAINANTQGVALRTQGDRQSFYNCRITGYQDTYLGNSIGRAYFKNCYIEGNVDFIFGRQTVVFDQCTTYVNRNASVLTAPSTEKTTKFGMVFLDCNLTAPSTSYTDFDGTTFKEFYYGRPWQQQPRSAFIRCQTPATLNEKGWTTMNGGLNPVFVEYGCTGEGATSERLSKRANEGEVLTEAAAAEYTIENIFKKDTDPSFAADWMPQAIPGDLTSIEPIVNDKQFKSYATPNPFVDVFFIHYKLNRQSDVAINLYDINGKLLKALAECKQNPGNYEIQVDGSHLSSGVYLYSMQTQEGKSSNKIIKK